MNSNDKYEQMNHTELVKKLKELERENQELQHFKQDFKQQELERSIIHEKLEFSWAGNLGRWEWNVKTGKVIFNPKKVQALGYEVSEFSPTVDAFTNLLHPDDYEATMDNMRRHLYGKIPAYEVEYRIKTRSGAYKWFYDRGRIVEYDNDGAPLKITGIVFDITEQKEFEARLEETNRRLAEANDAKNKVFNIIAHDLRNPFASIISFINLLEKVEFDVSKEENRYIISELKKITTNTDLLLQNLLSWSRSQTEKIEARPEEFELAPLIDSVCGLFETQAKGKDILLSQEVTPDLTALADENMLHTVLRNLISNAIKFSHPHRTITIRAHREAEEILIKVIDQGIGIETDELNKLFDIGSVFSTHGTQEEQGTGLGLKLSNELVKRNNGRLWVDSHPEQGSVFYISLPEK